MRAVVQRVSSARVEVDGVKVGEIGRGLFVLLGVARGDIEKQVLALAKKIVELRVFADEHGKMNLALTDVGGACLVVSQFTLLADTSRGRRPYFGEAEDGARAHELCRLFAAAVRDLGVSVAEGRFGADMQVTLCNDGPVTICLEL